MKTTISKLNTVVPVESANSDSSSEYTTPAQSQTTSPTREMSPPSFTAPTESMIKGLQALGLSNDQVYMLRYGDRDTSASVACVYTRQCNCVLSTGSSVSWVVPNPGWNVQPGHTLHGRPQGKDTDNAYVLTRRDHWP